MLNTIGEGDETQDMLLALAKSVANTSAALVVKARKCAETVDDPQEREDVISAAAQTALSASELVACAKVVAPTVSNYTLFAQKVAKNKLWYENYNRSAMKSVEMSL